MSTHVALLRGINVGGRNKLPMEDLSRIFKSAGCRDVRTYIQSGNVVFNAAPPRRAALIARVRAAIEQEFGYRIPIVVRTAGELARVVDDNPFATTDVDDKTLHVVFLSDEPEPAAIAALDPQRSPPDRFAVIGRQIFLHLPNGVARSKLTNAYFDRALETVSTARNWRTTKKLAEMAGR